MSDPTYGMPRIRAKLADDEIIACLMREHHIRGICRRRGYVVTTTRNPKERPAPDLVKREFVASDINQLGVADMTYIRTWAGFLICPSSPTCSAGKLWAGRLGQT